MQGCGTGDFNYTITHLRMEEAELARQRTRVSHHYRECVQFTHCVRGVCSERGCGPAPRATPCPKGAERFADAWWHTVKRQNEGVGDGTVSASPLPQGHQCPQDPACDSRWCPGTPVANF